MLVLVTLQNNYKVNIIVVTLVAAIIHWFLNTIMNNRREAQCRY